MVSVRDPLEFWLGRQAPVTRSSYRSVMKAFLCHSGLDGNRLIELRRAGDGYDLLDKIQEYVAGLELSLGAKKAHYNTLRSFFLHNRCALPDDSTFIIRSTRATVTPKLSLENVRALVLNGNPRDRSIVLVKWMSLVDTERLAFINLNCGEQIVEQMKSQKYPVRIDLSGRKRNQHGYYTFIGKDAVDSLREYFEKVRGWPKKGEAIWLGKGEPLNTVGLKAVWMRMTRRAVLIPKSGGKRGVRYGFGAHEMRDIAKSLLHTRAKSDGFDMDCCEFFLGHTVDPLGYDKFYQDKEYVTKQYLIAEKYLNIISVPEPSEEVKHQEEELKKMQQRLAEYESQMKRIAKLSDEKIEAVRQLIANRKD